MKEFILLIAIALFIVLLFGGIELTTKPFTFTIHHWRTAVAVMLFLIGGILIFRDGRTSGIKDVSNIVIKRMEEKK